MPIVRWFLCSVYVAQKVLYSTIVVVYFKQKSYVVKSDPYKAAKSSIAVSYTHLTLPTTAIV